MFEFATRQSLAAYIVRGVLGIGMIAAGFTLVHDHPYIALPLIFGGLVPLGGCPTCWLGGTIGAACAYRAPQNKTPR
jgi:hypothetical protein